MALLRRLRWPGLLALLVCSLACFWVAGSAWADEGPEPPGAPVCPGAPGSYHGDDEAAAAVYGSQLLDVELCRVLRYQLGQVVANTESSEGGGSASVTVTNAAAIAEPVAESVDASGESARHALWFLAGAVVALVAAFSIWRSGAIRG